MTGLPIIETKANDISAYVPTNVISITDGQLFLETDLFNSGVRPAINVGVSVSRVGGAAQVKALKQVAGSLRVDLAQYRDLEAFALFASDLDKASRQQLERGARMVELLKQRQFNPMPVQHQVISIWAGSKGYLDSIPVEDVKQFESELLEYMELNHKDIPASIRATGKLDKDLEAKLKEAVEAFAKTFRPQHAEAAPVNDVTATGDVDPENEQIQRQRRNPPSTPAGAGASGTP